MVNVNELSITLFCLHIYVCSLMPTTWIELPDFWAVLDKTAR